MKLYHSAKIFTIHLILFEIFDSSMSNKAQLKNKGEGGGGKFSTIANLYPPGVDCVKLNLQIIEIKTKKKR